MVRPARVPPCNLIESELFGHEKGAFTGAERQRRGRFELAHGGTLFLDEIGELPLEIQPELLRVLQDGQMERVGGAETISVDVGMIAATNRDPNADMEGGRFRENLFYRVAVYPITVPSLRDRRDDISILVQHFVQHFARRRGTRIDQVPAEVTRRLQAYDWPGNVRELQNVIERAVLTSTDEVLRLAEPLKSNSNGKVATRQNGLNVPGLTLDEVERRYIVQVLEITPGPGIRRRWCSRDPRPSRQHPPLPDEKARDHSGTEDGLHHSQFLRPSPVFVTNIREITTYGDSASQGTCYNSRLKMAIVKRLPQFSSGWRKDGTIREKERGRIWRRESNHDRSRPRWSGLFSRTGSNPVRSILNGS